MHRGVTSESERHHTRRRSYVWHKKTGVGEISRVHVAGVGCGLAGIKDSAQNHEGWGESQSTRRGWWI